MSLSSFPRPELPPHHPFSLEYTADPRPTFARAHAEDAFLPIEEMNAVCVHGYDAVRAFCDHPLLSRNPADAGLASPEALAARAERWPMLEGSMTSVRREQEKQSNLIRELLAPDFRPAMIRKMADTVQEVVQDVCAPLRHESALDVVKLVQEVPLRVISRLLGIDETTRDADLFLSCAPDYFRGLNPVSSDADRDKAEIAAGRMSAILARAVEGRRADPRTDLVSQVIGIADARGDVTADELVGALVILVAAGTDTTRLSTSLAVKTLLDHPEALALLREDRGKLKNAVMELLRYEGPTKFLVRAAVDDVEFEDKTVPKGSLVLLSIMGAGWDPRVFPAPEVFDVDRDLRGSLSFGFGSGYCLGVHLARLQVGTLVEYFLDHLPTTARVERDGISWDPGNLMLREITSLPIRTR
ncbi:MAG TPA: cytochrome P450 [Myxococcota bacterium]|nr:cytochrome P450 [Myxococcota bacterium]